MAVEHELRSGDRLQFTRNNYRTGRLSGHAAEVVAIDPAGSSMVVARDDGRREMLDMTHLADRHVRRSYRANIVDARALYARSAASASSLPSTPTAAQTSPKPSISATAPRSMPSTKPWRSPRWR
ncbi:hypothetical protein [uncultured Sphingomonas sp.]|uniref:hypothetical protein n=1 Tax=uncultured Sphingomonas sp. TaxID=158754 RepID=UPI0025CC0059|nr:hypothetical protein [uncultured Sphingomonas sp.]